MRLGTGEIEAVRRTRSYRSALWHRRGALLLVSLAGLSWLDTAVVGPADVSVLPAAVADFLANARAMFLGSAVVLGATSRYLLHRARYPLGRSSTLVGRSRFWSDLLRPRVEDPLGEWVAARSVLLSRRHPRARVRQSGAPLWFEPLSSRSRT